MPRLGMEPLRRRALIDAAIGAIGERGSLDVTMSEIAGRAGVSAALAHHYFGGKGDLLEATMRHLLRELGRESALALRAAGDPHARLDAIVSVNFSRAQFAPAVIAAWLAFYVEAQRSPRVRRLLNVYARRLQSNLVSALRPMLPVAEARRTAEALAAMIDGLYIRRALRDGPADGDGAAALVREVIAARLDPRRMS